VSLSRTVFGSEFEMAAGCCAVECARFAFCRITRRSTCRPSGQDVGLVITRSQLFHFHAAATMLIKSSYRNRKLESMASMYILCVLVTVVITRCCTNLIRLLSSSACCRFSCLPQYCIKTRRVLGSSSSLFFLFDHLFKYTFPTNVAWGRGRLATGVATYGAQGHLPPSTYNNLIFSVHFDLHKV